MNVFDLRDRLVGDYASYTASFIKIADARILAKVQSELDGGAFWPEPMLQLNPTFLPGGTVDDLVGQGAVHQECARIFRLDKITADFTGKSLQLPHPPAQGDPQGQGGQVLRIQQSATNYGSIISLLGGIGCCRFLWKTATFCVPVRHRLSPRSPPRAHAR